MSFGRANLHTWRLDELLRQLADGTAARTDIPISVTVSGDCAFAPDVQVALYRIAQEALNNVTKHARATRVDIRLDCSQDATVFSVSDDGRGMDIKEYEAHHLGLRIMRERAENIGAQLTLDSVSGEGTVVAVQLPAARDSSSQG